MRIMTSARARAVGFLLLEAAGLVLLFTKRVKGDDELLGAVTRFVKRVRAL